MNSEARPMVFGLTGIMGSGKSTAVTAFARHGAVIIDADQIVKQLQQPGQPILIKMAAILGQEVIGPNGELDRAKAAQMIFSDDDLRKKIEALIHPAVWKQVKQLIHQAKPSDIVILDVPLLSATNRINLAGIIVIDCPVELAIKRLVKYRGFSEQDCRARLAKQPGRQDLLKRADFVISNSSSRKELYKEVVSLWKWNLELNLSSNGSNLE